MISEKQTRTERLAEAISNAILAGEFSPGSRLDEQQLAQRFGVSRTPVREALRQLAASGLIDLRARRGALVAMLTPDQINTLFHAMAELEGICARLSALRMTEAERAELRALHEQMGGLAQAGDPAAYADANRTFHMSLYAGAHNAVLAEFATRLRQRLSPFRRAQFRLAGRPLRSHAEHAAVVTSVLGRDAAGAQAAMLHHVSHAEDAFGAFSAGARCAPT